MIQSTLDSLRRLWYAQILVCATMLVLATSSGDDRYGLALRLLEVLPRVGTDPLYYEQVTRGHNEFVALHVRNARQRFESGLTALPESGKSLNIDSYFLGWLNNVYDISRHTIALNENPRLSEIVELLRRLDRPSNAADPGALLDALRQALPSDCRPCSVAGGWVGPSGELITSGLTFRYPSGQLNGITLSAVPEYPLLRNARLSTQYNLLNRIPERSTHPPVDSDLIVAHVRMQSPPALHDAWLEIKDMTIQDAREYIRRREGEAQVKLSLFGLTLPPEISGFGAPSILAIFQLYFLWLIEHIASLWRRSRDTRQDSEVFAGYPWLPLFTGYKGIISVVITLLILPTLASWCLFGRLNPKKQTLLALPTTENVIQLALTVVASAGAALVVWRMLDLRAQVSRERTEAVD